MAATLSACSGQPSQKAEKAQKADDAKSKQEAVEANESHVATLTLSDFRTKVMDVTDKQKPKFVGKRPCIIDFYATWCGPCKQMAPTFAALSSRFNGSVDFYRVDVDQEEELAAMFGVESIPMFVYISSNGEVNSSLGAIPEDEMEANINNYCLK